MTFLRSLIMAFSCFSQVPMPHIDWRPESMRYMMGFFPFVGVVVGLLVAAWVWLCSIAGFGPMVRAAGITLVPLCVTGGIHMDGLADTCDALASNSPPERRLEILKDSHTGAFAVIGVGMYLIAYFAFATEFDPSVAMVQLALVPVLSRCLSGFATVTFPLSNKKGMLADEQGSSAKGAVRAGLVLIAIVCVGVLVWRSVVLGIAMAVVAVFCLLALYALSMRKFGGMNGDLAGFFLQMCELALLITIVSMT